MAMMRGYNFVSSGSNSHQRISSNHGKQRRRPLEDKDISLQDTFAKSSHPQRSQKQRQEPVPEWLKAQVKGFQASVASCVEKEKYHGYKVDEVFSRRDRERMITSSRSSLSLAYDRQLSERGDIIKFAFTFPIIDRYSSRDNVHVLEFGAVDGISANLLINQLRSNTGIEATIYLVNNSRTASLNYPGVERIESSPLELDIQKVQERYERLRGKNIDAVVMRFSLANYDQNQQLELLRTARSLLQKGGLLLIMEEGPEFGSDYNEFMHKILAHDSSIHSLRHYSSLAELVEMAREAEFALNDERTYGGKQNPLILTRLADSLLYCSSIEQHLCLNDAQREGLRSIFRNALENERLNVFQTRITSVQETMTAMNDGGIMQELISFDDFYIPREIYAVALKAV